MAMKACSECGKEISTKAQTCPYCGAPQKSALNKNIGCLPTLGIILLIIVVVSYCASPGTSTTSRPAAAPAPAAPQSEEQLVDAFNRFAESNPGRAVEVGSELERRFPDSPALADVQARLPALQESAAAATAEREARAAEQAAERERRAMVRKWSYDATADEMSSGVSHSAAIWSENEVTFGFPYGGAQQAMLMLRDHPRHGRDAIFRIQRGQLLCRSYEDCSILVRFDDAEATRWRAVGSADNSSETIFLRNVDNFRQRMRAAKTVRISVPVHQEGQPVFEFHVEGYDHERFQSAEP